MRYARARKYPRRRRMHRRHDGIYILPAISPFCRKKPGYLPDKIRRIGVFVDETLENIRSRITEYGLYGVQLHGNEPPHLCKALRSSGVKVIKAFSIRDRLCLEACRNYEYVCDYFLFDTPTPGYGGSGAVFDWKLLDRYNGKTPFLLSGGIGTEISDPYARFLILAGRESTLTAALKRLLP